MRAIGLFVLAMLWTNSLLAQAPASLSIIIDDIGYQLKNGRRAVELPGKLTYAFLPHSPYATRLAELAYRRHKEVMLHLPMQAKAGNKLGPGALTEAMSKHRFKIALHSALAAIPHVQGFNNHMGSLLTQDLTRMRWLMEAAMFHDHMYFVDSRTTAQSVAQREAARLGISNTRRDIFLDYRQGSVVVEHQLRLLIKRAKQKGTALAIGHPHPDTLAVLERWLPKLQAQGVRLVPVSELIRLRTQRRAPAWQMSSSRSRKVAKNSKQ